MKEKNTNTCASQVSSVREPEVAYSKLTPNHHTAPSSQDDTLQRGYMTVEEFANKLHKYVDEYYDSIQG